MFTDRDVDTVLYGIVLYGYVRSPCEAAADDDDQGALTGHALSGLRVEQLTYGQCLHPLHRHN